MGRPLHDLSGLRVGRLRVVERVIRASSQATLWKCRCACGNESIVTASNLATGKTRSCGCLAHERASRRLKTHGLSKTPEYFAWCQARARCRDEKHQAYEHYGARGIRVCPEWDADFTVFARDMGPRPSQRHTLERIDNNGPYAPGNCRWVTQQRQCNNRRSNVRLEFDGRNLTVADWARVSGLPRTAIYLRLRNGWSVERALTTPLQR